MDKICAHKNSKAEVGFGLVVHGMTSLSWSLEEFLVFESVRNLAMDIWIRLLPSTVLTKTICFLKPFL